MMLRLNKRFPSWLIVIGKGSIADSCYSNLPWFYLFFFFIFLCQWDFIKKSQVVWSSLHSFTGECPSFPAFCLWHGHCTVADWLKDTLIRSLSIWHVFSKESSLFFFLPGSEKRALPPSSLITLFALVARFPDSRQRDGAWDDCCHHLLTCQGLTAPARRKLLCSSDPFPCRIAVHLCNFTDNSCTFAVIASFYLNTKTSSKAKDDDISAC